MSFLCFPSIYFRRYSAADEESLRQRVSGFYSRWRVKGQLDARFAQIGLCTPFFRDWTFVIVFAAGMPLASGSRSSHLVWKISDWARGGHLQLQAFSSQQPNAETLQLLEASEEGGRWKSAARMSPLHFIWKESL